MEYEQILVGFALFALSVPAWLLVYRYYLADLFADIYVRRIESGDIDLNYMLEQGGVFDAVADRFITKFKQHLLAEQGQLTRAASNNIDGGDPLAMGIEASGELLKMVGFKKPPAMLQYKVAAALAKMGQKHGLTAADLTGAGPDLFAGGEQDDIFSP